MKAHFIQEDGVVIVRLKGHFDFESVDLFSQTCKQRLQNKKVIFNLERLNFVGSSGMDSFMEVLRKIRSISSLKICHVGCEFRRLFASCHLKNLEIYESEHSAKDSF